MSDEDAERICRKHHHKHQRQVPEQRKDSGDSMVVEGGGGVGRNHVTCSKGSNATIPIAITKIEAAASGLHSSIHAQTPVTPIRETRKSV